MKPQDEKEPCFITEDVKAELVAAGYEFNPPSHVRMKSTRELFGWKPGETLQAVMSRHSAKQDSAS